MTSSDEFVTNSVNELTAEEFANYQKWQAPHMVSVSDVEEGINSFLTVEEIEQMQKEAQEEGYSIGFEQGKQSGYEAGIQSGQADVNQQISYLQNIISSLNHPLKDLDQTIENDLVHLITLMATQVIEHELSVKPELIDTILKSAIAQLPINDRKLKIRLHPEDSDLVKDTLSLDNDDVTWQIIPDSTLSRGGCLLETADTRIDATIETRLNTVIGRLLGSENDDSTNN